MANEGEDINSILEWLAIVSGSAEKFNSRIKEAQEQYVKQSQAEDKSFSIFETNDVVANYFAQAKSHAEQNRQATDILAASKILPWVRQLGRHVNILSKIQGAYDRAEKMLKSETVNPSSTMFELIMAANYATTDLSVSFINETDKKTPDFELSMAQTKKRVFVECKRLERGTYQKNEELRHEQIFRAVEPLLLKTRRSLHIDVSYADDLSEVPNDYLIGHLEKFLSLKIILPTGYPWKDKYGDGRIHPANADAIIAELRESSLYCGPKMARLLSGITVGENHYHLAISGIDDSRDARFLDKFYYGSVITWRNNSDKSIGRKNKRILSKLAEADAQLATSGAGIIHMAMEMEADCPSSDVRQTRNCQTLEKFAPSSNLLAVYLHYLVPRVSEQRSWLIDENVDAFTAIAKDLNPPRIFTEAELSENLLPAWKQKAF